MRVYQIAFVVLILGILSGLVGIIFAVNFPEKESISESKKVLGVSAIESPSHSNANLTLEPIGRGDVLIGTIIEIVDSNSIKLLLNDGMEVVNLAGVRIPDDEELENYSNCFGEDVEDGMKNLFLGKKAYVIKDGQIDDQKGNPRYVFLSDLTFLNQEVIKQGLGVASSAYDYLYKEDFAKTEREAYGNSAGIFTKVCQVTPTPGTALSKKPTKTTNTPTSQNLYSKLLSPTPTNTPSPTPVIEAQKSTGIKPASLNPEILFVLINNHRQSIGKAPFEKEGRLCSLAIERGPELYDEIFVTRNVHAGLTKRNLPYWITENMAHYDTEEQVFNWWMGSTIHRRAIESDSRYSCGECFGNSCAQLFTSFTPK